MYFLATRYFVVQIKYILFPLPENLNQQDLLILSNNRQHEIKYIYNRYITRLVNIFLNDRYITDFLMKDLD